jgi:hypothetical protein
MKKTMFLVAAMLFVVATIQAQTIEKLFDKYSDDEQFEYVSIGSGMMNMASAFGGVGKADKEILSKMKGLKILTLKANAESNKMKALERDLKEMLENEKFESSLEARDKGERVNIYFKFSGKDKTDMLIVTKEKGEFSMIWISGKMSKEEMMNSF